MADFEVPPPVGSDRAVAVVAPSSGRAATYPHVYDLGVERLEREFGLDVVEYPTATKDDEYLYEHPDERAEDLHDAFENPDVDAVITTIGGNDQIRILDHLDPERLRSNPTRFFGISDNANVALYLYDLGIVSYYGGTLMTTFASPGSIPEYSRRWVERALFEDSLGEIEPAAAFTDQDLDWATPANLDREREFEENAGWLWRGDDGAVEGRLWGGCLETVHGYLAANRYAPSVDQLDGNVLLLETSELLPSAAEVRGKLIAMGERGILTAVDGVLVGRAKARTHRDERDPETRQEYRRRQRQGIEAVVAEYNPDAPIVFDLDVGHTDPEIPIPIGGEVRIDPTEERIVFE